MKAIGYFWLLVFLFLYSNSESKPKDLQELQIFSTSNIMGYVTPCG